MRQTEQVGTLDMSKAARERETPIVVAASHADPIAVAVESEQRHDDEIQVARGNQTVGMYVRFGDFVSVSNQLITWLPAAEQQPSMKKRVKYRQVAVLAECRGLLHERHGVDLTCAAKVPGKGFCPTKPGKLLYLPGNRGGSKCLRAIRQGKAYTFEVLAKCLQIVHAQRWVETFPACAGTCRHPRTVRFKWDRNGA